MIGWPITSITGWIGAAAAADTTWIRRCICGRAPTGSPPARSPNNAPTRSWPGEEKAMRGSHYYDRDGQPIDVDRWGELFEDRKYQRLAETRLVINGESVTVSTI